MQAAFLLYPNRNTEHRKRKRDITTGATIPQKTNNAGQYQTANMQKGQPMTQNQGKRTGAIAKALGVSPMTIRNYVKYFAPILSPGATSETGRLFTPQDESLLRRAAGMLRSGQTYEQVLEQLSQAPSIEGEILDDTEQQPPAAQDQEPSYQTGAAIAPLEFFNAMLDRIQNEHKSTLDAQTRHIEDLQRERDQLRAEVERLRRPWWKKMLGE